MKKEESIVPVEELKKLTEEGQRKVLSQLTPEERGQLEKALKQQVGSEIVFPDVNIGAKGATTPKYTIENTRALIVFYSIRVRYNEMSKDFDIEIPNQFVHNDLENNVKLTRIHDLCKQNDYDIGVDALDRHLQAIGSDNAYHPVKEWIASKPWDGVSRLQDFYDSVVADNNVIKEMLMHRWARMAVAALFHGRGFMPQGVLVFQGEQGQKKTRWIKSIVANHNWVAVGENLDPNNTDSVSRCVTKWIIELGEIEGVFKRADMAALKSFISRDQDRFRNPYARKQENYTRQTVFFGSVNDKEYLTDPTGNRRFWTVAVENVEVDHGIDCQQLWAEIYQLYLKDKTYWLIEAEAKQLEKYNEGFTTRHSIEAFVERRFRSPHESEQFERLTASEIAQKITGRVPSIPEAKAVGNALRRMKIKYWKATRVWTVKDLGAIADLRKVSTISDGSSDDSFVKTFWGDENDGGPNNPIN